MMRPRFEVITLTLLLGVGAVQAATDFSKDVEPLLKKRCAGCHSGASAMNGLHLEDGEGVLKGGYSGPAVVAGKSAESRMIARVTTEDKAKRMPPGPNALPAAEIAVLKAWIDEGAKVPAAAAKKSDAKPKPSVWSFQPITRPAAPATRNRNWTRNPIDNFILAKLESESIAPSQEADRATLLRRLKLDLIGLPPTLQETEEFLSDNRPDYYEKWVDKFMASPHYGERWARPWLDLAHYADSDGYEKDLVRPWAWRYRQWVINALNDDMPFDKFTIAQLAGDLLPNGTVEDKVATGFLTNTLTNREAGVDRAESRFEQLVNRTNTVSTVWLGLTVGCAQCHNHKYDPISQKDFYQILAFMNKSEEDLIDAPVAGELGPYLRARPAFEKKRAELLAEYKIPELQARWEVKMRDAIKNPGKDVEFDFWVTSMTAMVDNAQRLLLTEPDKRRPRDTERLTEYFVGNPGPEFNKDKELQAKFKELRGKLNDLKKELPQYTQAQVMRQHPENPKTYIAVRGDYRNNGIEVTPGALEVLPALEKTGAEATRLDFAKWIVAKNNPLTSRVAVNRMWQEFFGRGLVRTSEDFGLQGEKPTHPELLDYLATEFMDRGWSMKAMHKLIVTSATYRQSSKARPELAERDPENTLLSRQNRVRLPAELIRDSALAASGLLNPQIGGKSVRPYMPAGVAELGYGGSVKWVESEGVDKYRRGLYIHFQRTTPYPMLMNFDAPDSNVTCSRRRASNTPLQALNLLNDPVFSEASKAFAYRINEEAPAGLREKVERMFMLTLSRKPSATERERLGKYLDQQIDLLRKEGRAPEVAEREAWAGMSRIVFNLDEFITRE